MPGYTDHVAAISGSYIDPALDPLHVVRIEYFRPGTRCLAHTHAHSPAVSLFLLQSVLLIFLRSLPGRLSSFLWGKEIGWIPPIFNYALYVCQRALLDDAVARPRLEWQVVERLQPILRLLGQCILAYNLDLAYGVFSLSCAPGGGVAMPFVICACARSSSDVRGSLTSGIGLRNVGGTVVLDMNLAYRSNSSTSTSRRVFVELSSAGMAITSLRASARSLTVSLMFWSRESVVWRRARMRA